MMSSRLTTIFAATCLLALLAIVTVSVAGEVNVIRTAFKSGERLHARQPGTGWSGSRAVDISGPAATSVAQCQNACQSKYRYCQSSCKSFTFSGQGDPQGACLNACDREVDPCQTKCTQPKTAAPAPAAPKIATPAAAAAKPRPTPDYSKTCSSDAECTNGLTCEMLPTGTRKYCDNKIHLPGGSCHWLDKRCPPGYKCKAKQTGGYFCLPQ